MRRRTKLLAGASSLLVVLAFTASCVVPWPLDAGDRAPPLEARWLSGDPVDPQTSDQLTVVELWATWCGPCLDTIDDLDAAQRRWRAHGVRVVAVAVWDDLANVERFVAARGADLSYAIAFDEHGDVRRRWRTGFFENYVPTMFVVGRDGCVVAVTLVSVLDRVIAAELDATRVVDDVAAADYEALRAATEAEDHEEVARLADRCVASRPTLAGSWQWKLASVSDPAARVALARQAIEAVGADALQLAVLVEVLARNGTLEAVAQEAHAAMQRCSTTMPVLQVPASRLFAAAAAGQPQLDAAVDAEVQRLRAEPHELLALARHTARTWGMRLPPRLTGARVRLVEAAAEVLGQERTAPALLEALLAAGGDEARVEAVGRLAVARLRGDVPALNSLAWDLLTDEDSLARARTTALRAAEAMTEVDGWDTPDHLDTLALARFENGDVDGAIDAQRRAIAGLATPREAFQTRLERYLAARAGGETK